MDPKMLHVGQCDGIFDPDETVISLRNTRHAITSPCGRTAMFENMDLFYVHKIYALLASRQVVNAWSLKGYIDFVSSYTIYDKGCGDPLNSLGKTRRHLALFAKCMRCALVNTEGALVFLEHVHGPRNVFEECVRYFSWIKSHDHWNHKLQVHIDQLRTNVRDGMFRVTGKRKRTTKMSLSNLILDKYDVTRSFTCTDRHNGWFSYPLAKFRDNVLESDIICVATGMSTLDMSRIIVNLLVMPSSTDGRKVAISFGKSVSDTVLAFSCRDIASIMYSSGMIYPEDISCAALFVRCTDSRARLNINVTETYIRDLCDIVEVNIPIEDTKSLIDRSHDKRFSLANHISISEQSTPRVTNTPISTHCRYRTCKFDHVQTFDLVESLMSLLIHGILTCPLCGTDAVIEDLFVCGAQEARMSEKRVKLMSLGDGQCVKVRKYSGAIPNPSFKTVNAEKLVGTSHRYRLTPVL